MPNDIGDRDYREMGAPALPCAMTETLRPELRLYAERACETAEDLIEALSPATGALAVDHRFEAQRWLFRGQGDAAWPLKPKALRPNALAVLLPSQVELPFTNARDQAELELAGIVTFAVQADRAGFLLPGDAPALRDPRLPPTKTDLLHFPPAEYLALAGLAQHYGVPTRLLDWTFKPYVAAYFAAWDCIDNHQAPRTHTAVWALSANFVNAVGPMRDPAFYLVSAPSASNPNLHAQGGVFTLVQPRSTSTMEGQLPNIDDLLFTLDREDIDPPTTRAIGMENMENESRDDGVWSRERLSPVIMKFTLPVKEVRVLVRLLAELGVSAATITPGLAGVAKSILEARSHQWAQPASRSR